jgi:biopolymer transport protein ExbD
MITPKRQNASVCKPQITSLIDVMTILLVFLMVNFSVDGSLVTPSADLELPESSSRENPEPVTVLELTATAVLVQGETIVRYTDFPGNDSLSIPSLAVWLRAHRSPDKPASPGKQASPGRRSIMLQADRRIPFAVIKRVMYTCSKTGFDDFTILVRQEG